MGSDLNKPMANRTFTKPIKYAEIYDTILALTPKQKSIQANIAYEEVDCHISETQTDKLHASRIYHKPTLNWVYKYQVKTFEAKQPAAHKKAGESAAVSRLKAYQQKAEETAKKMAEQKYKEPERMSRPAAVHARVKLEAQIKQAAEEEERRKEEQRRKEEARVKKEKEKYVKLKDISEMGLKQSAFHKPVGEKEKTLEELKEEQRKAKQKEKEQKQAEEQRRLTEERQRAAEEKLRQAEEADRLAKEKIAEIQRKHEEELAKQAKADRKVTDYLQGSKLQKSLRLSRSTPELCPGMRRVKSESRLPSSDSFTRTTSNRDLDAMDESLEFRSSDDDSSVYDSQSQLSDYDSDSSAGSYRMKSSMYR